MWPFALVGAAWLAAPGILWANAFANVIAGTMAAGLAGLTQVLTAGALDALARPAPDLAALARSAVDLKAPVTHPPLEGKVAAGAGAATAV